MSEKKVYVKGMNLKPPKKGRGAFVKFEVGINLEKFRTWLEEQLANGNIKDRNGWVNIDVCDPWEPGDSYNITLNNWTPSQTNGATPPTPPMPAFDDAQDDRGPGAI